MAKFTSDDYRNMFYKIPDSNEYDILSEYKGMAKKITLRHNVCNTSFEVNARTPIERKRITCPKCAKNYTYVIENVNDIYTTNPEVYDLLENKEDGHKYKAYSSKKVNFKCPFCGNVHAQIICHVTERGFSCPSCGDHCGSYAEKFVFNLLEQYNIKPNREFSPEWIKPYRYDLEFSKDGVLYIIEIDGGWHYTDNKMSKMTVEQSQNIDMYKQNMAIKNGYKVIRINNDYKGNDKRNYIINSIKNSELSYLFDLSKADFDKCNYYASHSSMVNKVAQIWLNGIRSAKQIADMLEINITSVRNYLNLASNTDLIPYSYDTIKELNKEYYKTTTRVKPRYDNDILKLWLDDGVHNVANIANDLEISKSYVRSRIIHMCDIGLIPFSYEEVLQMNFEYDFKNTKKKGQKVMCNETGEIFDTMKEASEKYHGNIVDYFLQDNRKFAGKLADGTSLTCTKL